MSGRVCVDFTISSFYECCFSQIRRLDGISFDNDPLTYLMLEGNTPYWEHQSEATNYYKGGWIRNPVQNNLIELSVDERIEVIRGYINREKKNVIENYADWLKTMFGAYFAENFPYKYTRKYWTVNPEKLAYQWIDGRMYVPTLDEMLRGAMEETDSSTHYSKVVRYPKMGGFKSFLNPLVKGRNILDKIMSLMGVVLCRQKYIIQNIKKCQEI